MKWSDRVKGVNAIRDQHLTGRLMTKETIKQLIDQFGLGGVTLRELLGEDYGGTVAAATTRSAAVPRDTLQAAIYCYDARRTRERHFAGHLLFADPAWDILLDLFIHEARGELVSVKSASIGSGVPPSTALRWLKILEGEGLISSRDDPGDHRRRLVSLTPKGARTMIGCLAEISA